MSTSTSSSSAAATMPRVAHHHRSNVVKRSLCGVLNPNLLFSRHFLFGWFGACCWHVKTKRLHLQQRQVCRELRTTAGQLQGPKPYTLISRLPDNCNIRSSLTVLFVEGDVMSTSTSSTSLAANTHELRTTARKCSVAP